VAADPLHDPAWAPMAGRLGLEAGGERVERLRVAAAGHARGVELRCRLILGRYRPRPELVRRVYDDLAAEIAPLLHRDGDRVP
jgi:hypothetical protein